MKPKGKNPVALNRFASFTRALLCWLIKTVKVPLACSTGIFLLGIAFYSAAAAQSTLLTQDAVEASAELYPLEDAKKSAQFKHLLKELRCLVCQNQDLSDSHAPLAKDLRQQVYEMVQANKSDQEVVQYLTDRYGDFILFNPPIKPLTYVLWLGPLVFLILGTVIFLRTCRRSNASA